ncbi:hypothetical protein ECZU03_49240 [Escherichia coli]|nr:hypothetical protein ECZU03_49240 [Escherichia coli]
MARGTSRSPEIWPGRRIALTGHPQANLNREWQVVASELHGEQPQAVPGRRGSGTTLNNHFAVIPADRTWRPQPLLKPLVDGPQSAVVTGPAGEEIFCDEHGRVRVKFNWDRYNPSNRDSSCWIRVAQAWAGTGDTARVRKSLWTSSTAIRTSRLLWGVPTTRKTAPPAACREQRRR